MELDSYEMDDDATIVGFDDNIDEYDISKFPLLILINKIDKRLSNLINEIDKQGVTNKVFFFEIVTKHHQVLEGNDLAFVFVHCSLEYRFNAHWQSEISYALLDLVRNL
uniref:Uncharacterized protein n=1 Tax=Romanomermis culicivorax TaxID=13658 RepID=A0A915KKK1_ROMCU